MLIRHCLHSTKAPHTSKNFFFLSFLTNNWQCQFGTNVCLGRRDVESENFHCKRGTLNLIREPEEKK